MIQAILQFISNINAKATVDMILKDFHNAIAKLEAAEQREVKRLEQKVSQIAQLEAEKIGHALESERAQAIRAKLEALVK